METALRDHLHQIAPDLASEFADIDAGDPSAMVRLLKKLNKIKPKEAELYHKLIMPKVQQEGVDRIVMADLLERCKSWDPFKTPQKYKKDDPAAFELIVACLPWPMAQKLAEAAEVEIDDTRISIKYDPLYSEFNDLHIVFEEPLFEDFFKSVGEQPSNLASEIIASIEVRKAGDLLETQIKDGKNEPFYDPMSKHRARWIVPLDIMGVSKDSELSKFRFKRPNLTLPRRPGPPEKKRKYGLPTEAERKKQEEIIKNRLHMKGLSEGSEERLRIEASLKFRSAFFRRRLIFRHSGDKFKSGSESFRGLKKQALEKTFEKLLKNGGLDHIEYKEIQTIEQLSEQGFFGKGGLQKLLDEGRAQRLIEIISDRCDDFPFHKVLLQDLEKEESIYFEIWRTPLPFYDFHDLYELVIFQNGKIRRSIFLFGDNGLAEKNYPENLEPWRLQPLNGHSSQIHELNQSVGVDVRSPELAAEYIRFFSNFSTGANAWSTGYTIVEEMSDAQLLGDNKPPISKLYEDEIALLEPMITPLVVREGARENPVKGRDEKEIELSDKTHSNIVDKYPEFYVIGATFTRNRRFFYSEFIIPKIEIDQPKKGKIPVNETQHYPIVMSPLPVRLIGSGLVNYTLDEKHLNEREGI